MLLQKAKDCAFWEKVRNCVHYQPLVDELKLLWEKECCGDIPACKYSQFIVFNQTGSRVEYEKPYYQRRRALNTAALLSLIYPEETCYFTKLCDVIWAILDEYTWVIPAHMPSFTENVLTQIDLFAAETCSALTEIDAIFEDRLPALIRSRIRYEIQRRIIDTYMGEKRFFWEKAKANWAAVCLCGVSLAIMHLRPELFETIRPRIEETIRCYLSGIPEDGTCLEGFDYWHYGFGYFVTMADALQEFTGGEMDYFSLPKVQALANYPQQMFLDGGAIVSFSDSLLTGEYHIGLTHFLKHKYPDTVQVPPRAYSYSNDKCGRWCMHLRAFLWFDETLQEETVSEQTCYAAQAQWLIRKSKTYGFAAKGGCNAEPHNHNDLGSFIVTKNGEQILCDPGPGVYRKQYFGETRYENFHPSSRGHSVPIIGGQYQKNGAEYCANAAYEDGIFTVEFSRGYGIEALRELRRSFTFTERSITMTDRFVLEEKLPIVERLISRKPVDITDDGIQTGGLTLKTNTDAQIGVHEEAGVFCIDLALAPGTCEFRLTIET